MTEHWNEIFEDRDVRLDGRLFYNCQFSRCRLIYAAAAPTHLSENTIDDCEFVFEAAALHSLAFLQDLYHGIPDGGPQVVGVLVDHLMEGTIAEGPTALAVQEEPAPAPHADHEEDVDTADAPTTGFWADAWARLRRRSPAPAPSDQAVKAT